MRPTAIGVVNWMAFHFIFVRKQKPNKNMNKNKTCEKSQRIFSRQKHEFSDYLNISGNFRIS